MRKVLLEQIATEQTPDSLADQLEGEPGLVMLRTSLFDSPQARFSFVTARSFLMFRSAGSRCEIGSTSGTRIQFGDPWRLLQELTARFEIAEEVDLPLPLGGCFGYWGYELKNFVEPKLSRRAVADVDVPDCVLGLYSSLVAFDHRLGKTWIVATGLDADGSRSGERARAEVAFWRERLAARTCEKPLKRLAAARSATTGLKPSVNERGTEERGSGARRAQGAEDLGVDSNLSKDGFIRRVRLAQDYIRAGDIYQVNLSHRLTADYAGSPWALYEALSGVSPAPFSAYLDCGDYQIASSSPELFLRLSGRQVQTQPIKGTRPRAADPTRDAQLAYELQTSSKELAELVMITDLLRNDLGRVCEYGSVQVPALARLERFAQVQHLVSLVEGRLRPEVTHLDALAACFPGGSITGAPKFRAMEIIDELEPVARGPYTGVLGYLGFNQESQLSIIIRAAVCRGDRAYFNVGAGIVADSSPESEHAETLAKARGFVEALQLLARAGLVARPNRHTVV